MAQYDLERLELVRSDLGDGGWSIHVRRKDIDEHDDPVGAWPIVASGEGGRWSDRDREWARPNKKDWALARSAARRLAKGQQHHTTKKSPAQLQREIDEVLAKPVTATRKTGHATRAKVTEGEIAYAMELLDAPGGDKAEDEVLRILKRDMSEAHARRVLRAAIDTMSRT